MFQMSKTTVVITAAHADAMTGIVKNHDGYDDQIEAEQRHDVIRFRLPDAVTIDGQIRVRVRFAEAHRVCPIDDRQENSLTGVPRVRNDRPRIDFVPGWKVTGDPAGRTVTPVVQKPPRDDGRARLSLLIRHRTTRLFCSGSQFGVCRFGEAASHRFGWRCEVHRSAVQERRRLPPVPSQTVALEPEQQVGSAVAATGFPLLRSCSNAADRSRPRECNLGSKGIQVGVEHCRRHHVFSIPLRPPRFRDRAARYCSERCQRGR